MLHYSYMLYLILFECVIVYCKNHTTYTFNPRISHVRFLSIPKNVMFLGNSHQNSMKTLNRNRFQNYLANKEPDDEDTVNNDFDDYKNSKLNNSKSDDRDDSSVDFREDNYNNNDNNLQKDSNQTNEESEDDDRGNSRSDFLEGPPDDYDQQDNDSANHHYKQLHVSNSDQNNKYHSNNNNDDENPPQEVEENKQIVNDIAKEEQMKDMHTNAGQMMDTAKQAKERADELLNQYKEGSYTSDTNKHSLPKDEAGNIIITNTTTTPTLKHEEEKVDPLKSIRDATLSLFERAKHKNLPVSDPGDLSTPEQIYTALNSLEYIIDGYRYTKIDLNESNSKDDNDNNPSESENDSFMDKEDSSSMGSEDNDNNENSDSNTNEDEESLMDPDRFLQVKKKDDDDDDDDFGNDEEDEEPDDDEDEEKGDFHKEEEDENDQDNEEDDLNNKSNDKKEKTLSPHEAMEDLRGVLTKLSSILEQVVLENTGVKGVIMRESVKVE